MWANVRDGWKLVAITLLAGTLTGAYIAYRTLAVNESTTELCRRIDMLANAMAGSFADQAENLSRSGAPGAAYYKVHPSELTARRVELNAMIVRIGSAACDPDEIAPPPPITVN